MINILENIQTLIEEVDPYGSLKYKTKGILGIGLAGGAAGVGTALAGVDPTP